MLDVTTFAVVWIEIGMDDSALLKYFVTTFAVVWIEIGSSTSSPVSASSPPSRWCGLKFLQICLYCSHSLVTTFAVVWIEILSLCPIRSAPLVTTFAVVWIEIMLVLGMKKDV